MSWQYRKTKTKENQRLCKMIAKRLEEDKQLSYRQYYQDNLICLEDPMVTIQVDKETGEIISIVDKTKRKKNRVNDDIFNYSIKKDINTYVENLQSLLTVEDYKYLSPFYDTEGNPIEWDRNALKSSTLLEDYMYKKTKGKYIVVRLDIRNIVSEEYKSNKKYTSTLEMERIFTDIDFKKLMKIYSYQCKRTNDFDLIEGYFYTIEKGDISGRWHMHLFLFLKMENELKDLNILQYSIAKQRLDSYLDKVVSEFYHMAGINNYFTGKERIHIWRVYIEDLEYNNYCVNCLYGRNIVRKVLSYLCKKGKRTMEDKKEKARYIGRSVIREIEVEEPEEFTFLFEHLWDNQERMLKERKQQTGFTYNF